MEQGVGKVHGGIAAEGEGLGPQLPADLVMNREDGATQSTPEGGMLSVFSPILTAMEHDGSGSPTDRSVMAGELACGRALVASTRRDRLAAQRAGAERSTLRGTVMC